MEGYNHVLQPFQKFGSLEGKSSKELMQQVKKAKRRYEDFTPSGAESYREVSVSITGLYSIMQLPVADHDQRVFK